MVRGSFRRLQFGFPDVSGRRDARRLSRRWRMSLSSRRTRLVTALGAAVALVTLAACGGDSGTGASGGSTPAATTGGGGEASGKIALLLPESKTARYEAFDRPFFEAKVKALC